MTAHNPNDQIIAAMNDELGIDPETEAVLEMKGEEAILNNTIVEGISIATLAEKLDKLDGLQDNMVGDLPLSEVIGDILDIEGLTSNHIHTYVMNKFGEEKVDAAFRAAQQLAYSENDRAEGSLAEFDQDDMDDEEFEALLNAMMAELFG